MKISFLFLVLAFIIPSGLYAQTVRELYEQAVEAYGKQDYDRAVDLYQAITKDSPRFAPAYVGIGLALKAKGADIEEVLYYYKTATDMDPTNTQALEQLGRLYYSVNRFDKAEKVFAKALRINPSMLDTKLSLAWIYLLYKPRPQVAIKYFQDILKVNKDPSVYLGLGMSYFANNERVKAMDIITQLKGMGHEDYAKRLEQAIRENRKVVLDTADYSEEVSSDDVSQKNQEITSEVKSAEAKELVLTPAAPPIETGVKVRLRGKLSQID